ncbi:hypothetical protein [Streptomyces cylindrosporus]|uniref:Uncharacterized protein n=1 Tax=Streptomyces cylindrosporus TaxID=2927583 RepID=A0ABS9Y6Y2_9ACTN|nr:hypothetical protein [Streptomyces cylindrosporus]MCI3272744.1 hypothetical protein [Streptomyces cylindrosporus]
MRRWLCCALLLGVVAVLGVAAPASAKECGGDFPARLQCWKAGLNDGVVGVTLRSELRLDGTKTDRAAMIKGVLGQSGNLEVQVPAGATTGEGGTVLLMLATQGHRLVDRKAVITPLSSDTRNELDELCSQRESFCSAVDDKKALTGDDLIRKGLATSHQEYEVGSLGNDDGLEKWLLLGTATALAVLLIAFVFVVRRTRAAPAATPTPRTADEPTRALRTTTRAAPSRRVGPTHPATVRTPLHPQGYVELGRVLYRAVWAEPAEPPSAPGSRVDVADPPDPGSDVLYAYPPAPARHARAH